MSKRNQKLLTNPTREQVEAAAKAGRPLVLLPALGETCTLDRVQMLPGGARRKVHAWTWTVRRMGTEGNAAAPVLTLEAYGRNDLVRDVRRFRARRYSLRDLCLSVGAGAVLAAGIMAALRVWVL